MLVDAGVEFDEVDIGGHPDLEARYREWLPVLEIDGVRAFVYYVDQAALLRRLKRRPTASAESGAQGEP